MAAIPSYQALAARLAPLPPPAHPSGRLASSDPDPEVAFGELLAQAQQSRDLPDWSGLIDPDPQVRTPRLAPPGMPLAPEPAIGPPRHTMAAPPEPPTLETLEAALDPRERRRIDDTAREMEGLFLKVVLAQLQRSMGVKGGAFGDSFQGEFYTGLAMEQMGEGMAGGREGGIGVGRVIYEQLVRATAGQTVWPD